MKRFYLSIAVLLAVLALCFAGAYTITSRSDIVGAVIDNVKQYAEKEDYAGAAQAAQRLCDSWSREQNCFVPFINMTRIDAVSRIVYSIPALCTEESRDHLFASLSELDFLINDMKEAERFSLFSFV